MYRISEFSRITKLTVKALRYYDKQGILQPSYRTEKDYRMYDDKDFERAELISMLRSLEFSIAEIKDTLTNCVDKEDLYYYLSEKKSSIEHNIQNEKALIEKLDQHLFLKNNEERSINYQIEIKELDAVNVASISFRGAYSDVEKYIGTIYNAVKEKINGSPFTCHHNSDCRDLADMELCIPIKGIITSNEVKSRQFFATKAICTIHKGSYETLNLAYKALLDYAIENKVECKLPSREIYYRGPGMIFKGNPNNYVTEIAIPI